MPPEGAPRGGGRIGGVLVVDLFPIFPEVGLGELYLDWCCCCLGFARKEKASGFEMLFDVEL
jgi:hypothetical protein